MERSWARIFALGVLSTAVIFSSYAQDRDRSGVMEPLLASARDNISRFPQMFKDLAAEEVKTIEVYDKPNFVSGRKRIVSDFFIYQSPRDPAAMAEFRDVREVDGVPVPGREKRATRLFERLSKADSVAKELERINREGSRYDFGWKYEGFTLQRALPLQASVHSLFSFEMEGREKVNGCDVMVIRFSAKPGSATLRASVDWLSDFKLIDPRYRGRLWVDVLTAQLWREEVELTMRSSPDAPSVVVSRFEFFYIPGNFEAWLPERLVFSAFAPIKNKSGAVPETYLRARTTSEYRSFKRFDVFVNELKQKDV